MPDNRKEIGDPPFYITCDPLSRTFPPGWKDVCFRLLAHPDDDGIVKYHALFVIAASIIGISITYREIMFGRTLCLGKARGPTTS